MELRAVLIDDEAQSREILRNYLEKYCPEVAVKGEAADVTQGVAVIREQQPDLVFLDVEMPFGNAFDLLEQLPDRAFETIFVTAYQQYAMEALNSHAAYYLMKPISIDALVAAVEYVREIKGKEDRLHDRVLKGVQRVEGKITLPQQDGFEVLDVSDIHYCKADDNYTEIHLEKRRIVVSKTLKYFEEALQEYPFVRVHKSYIVNVGEVVRYRRGKGGSVVLASGKEILVAPSRKKQLLSYFE
ncbi:LytTR family DNA-binding domain-containing protein [Robiginitalea sp. M366]|uniref:LytR/AlgR family response regulator transcription factor n=1 Tax=Robiginitalea aestuariiviva TaxID=3036903 RepID=UPI00240DD3EF|nr:LytTR family DNA-binding domain-containing protein [Robiginitalea aestuariiviva]MDG1570980.1 LytTR family DNA-binding domain-containing protein [Robiginitalea aestuariiviva]